MAVITGLAQVLVTLRNKIIQIKLQLNFMWKKY